MADESLVSGQATRKRIFEETKTSIGADVDRIISLIDASSAESAVAHAEAAIADAGKLVETQAVQRLSAEIPEAAANSVSSIEHLNAIASERASAEKTRLELPPPNRVQLVMAILYCVAAGMAFFTELKLTDSLVDLLGYAKNDPTGRAIGAAFASSMLVFELIFIKLCLVDDPWPLFRAAESDGHGGAKDPKAVRYLRLGGVALVLISLGIAGLTAFTIIKMAPTREIAGRQIHEQKEISDADKKAVQDATLLFSVCVLISGGYLAAAGTKQLTQLRRCHDLEKKIEKLDRDRKEIVLHLDKEEKPTLASALAEAELPSLWLPVASPEGFVAELQQALHAGLNGGNPIPEAIRAAAAAEAGIFAAEKQIALSNARTNVPPAPPPRPRKSWREEVDDVLQGDVVS